ncbi:MAG: OsmC family peroxiredoxin [Nitriliruptor sp.]|uniref:OsmC family peroxiredoxin n=1 Tax=Nitriliruptor sp. TaxID=2448056 RepID=UPI0034A06AA2
MTTSSSKAHWNGDLKGGSGQMIVGPDRYEGPFTFASRFEGSGDATNPEELLAAAHAGCFSMALSNILASDGHTPDEVRTEATITLGKVDDEPAITEIALATVGKVPGIDEATFTEYAQKAKDGCPVSKLFAGGTAEITLEVTFES